MIIDVIIPAWNEEPSIGKVVSDIDRTLVRRVIVVDNNSRDRTAQVASAAGAIVITEKEQGYGAACLAGIALANSNPQPADVIVFMDADYSDYAHEMPLLLAPLTEGYDMVIGSRALGQREKGSMTPQQVFGNALATWLIRIIYRFRYTDLGPYRAIKREALNRIGMRDRNYGWTVEMQIKALQHGLNVTEVAVNYRRRIGVSKVSGTLKGTILAGYKIITTIFRYALWR
ncbi:MAG: glycosyltransferase family 2 protein [Flavobacteriales bacterium]